MRDTKTRLNEANETHGRGAETAFGRAGRGSLDLTGARCRTKRSQGRAVRRCATGYASRSSSASNQRSAILPAPLLLG